MSRFGFRTINGLIYPIMQGISPIPPVLDVYPTANAAYSLRLLRTAYTGNAIRVRRSSDNTELNIGFIGSDLDTTTLTNFVGAGNGFVTTWYDQSGNVQNLTQTTAAAQPIIITSGVLETQLGRPAVKFSKVRNDTLTTTAIINNPFSIIGVVSQDLTSLGGTRIFSSTSLNSMIVIRRSDSFVIYTSASVVTSLPSQVSNRVYLMSFLRQTSTSYVYQDNILVPNTATSTANWGTFAMSNSASTESFTGKISEAIIYSNNQNANISGIHSNINSYYTIY